MRWLTWLTLIVLVLLVLPGLAWAGVVDDMVAKLLGIDTTASWWLSTVTSVSGLLGLVMALAPQGSPGGLWDRARTGVNLLSSNWGSARNSILKE